MAVKTRAELKAENASDFPDNTARLISPTDLRGQMDDIVDSVLFPEDGFAKPLLAATTLYVRTDGNDANSGLANTTAGAFLTPQAAVNRAYEMDLGGFSLTIQFADGTYNTGCLISGPMRGASNAVPLRLRGNVTTPASCMIAMANGNCIDVQDGAIAFVEGFKLSTGTPELPTSGQCLNVSDGGELTWGVMDFGFCSGLHAQATDAGTRLFCSTNYTISGGAVAHYHNTTGAYMLVQNCTITLTGTPAWSQYFLGNSGAYSQFLNVVFSGAATGKRYGIHYNGIVNTAGQGRSYFPGTDVATPGGPSTGDLYSGGQYDDLEKLVTVSNEALSPAKFTNAYDSDNVQVVRSVGKRATPTNFDGVFNSYHLNAVGAIETEFVRTTAYAVDVTAKTARLVQSIRVADIMTNVLFHDATNSSSVLPFRFPAYTKTTLPAATFISGAMIYVTDDVGGAVMAFSDGTSWRRVTDRAVIA